MDEQARGLLHRITLHGHSAFGGPTQPTSSSCCTSRLTGDRGGTLSPVNGRHHCSSEWSAPLQVDGVEPLITLQLTGRRCADTKTQFLDGRVVFTKQGKPVMPLKDPTSDI